MALPTSMSPGRDPLKKTGIVVGVYGSSDPLCETELWRSTQVASTASSLWSITRYPPSTTPAYTLAIPLAATTRYNYFKARSQKIGHSASTFTPVVRAKPVIFSQYPTQPPPLTNNTGAIETVVPIYAEFNNTINVGAPSQVAPTTYIIKTLRVPYSEFVPDGATTAFKFTDLYVTPRGSNNLDLYGAAVLPKGVILTGFSARLYRNSSVADAAGVTLQRNASDASTTIASVGHSTAAGWKNSAVTGLSILVGEESYTMACSLGNGTTNDDARLQYVEFQYRMPSYDRAY